MSSSLPVLTDALVNPPAYGWDLGSILRNDLEPLDALARGSTLEATAGYDWTRIQPETKLWFSSPQIGLPFGVLSYEDTGLYGIRGHSLIEDHNRDGVDRKARPVCSYCNKDFGRSQELERHVNDIHLPPRQCPFCTAKWTRAYQIKAHLLATHSKRFSHQILGKIEALRGQRLIDFLYGLVHRREVDATS
ncbi:hypothetical protein F5148DRAFT_839769 [Russula earlei]|uniref:Uncharacterized protein n=1 Tax=Russula earlei TaxID=71964 RepID=A0ACC0UAW1_9AGAM|nr:hypothetical protein F5148DRAFT_839769 [Russula earlei]